MDKLTLTAPGPGGGYRFSPVEGQPTGGQNTLENIISNGITILLIIVIILALVFLIWGGVEWITSGGSKEKIQAAQKKIIFASVGLLIALGSFMIINIIGKLFGITFFGV